MASFLNQNAAVGAQSAFLDIFNEVRADLDKSVVDAYVKRVDIAGKKYMENDWIAGEGVPYKWVGNRVFPAPQFNVQREEAVEYTKNTRLKISDYNSMGTAAIADFLKRFVAQESNYIDALCLPKLMLGFSGSSAGSVYDNVAFFSNAHEGPAGGTQSNVGSTALAQGSLETAIQTQTALKDTNGEPMNIRPNKLMVGPNYFTIAMNLVQSEIRAQGMTSTGLVDTGTIIATAGVTNVYSRLGIDPVLHPRIAGGWFLFDDKIPPILLGTQMPLTPMTNEGVVSDTPYRVWGVDAVFAVGYGDWHRCFGSTA